MTPVGLPPQLDAFAKEVLSNRGGWAINLEPPKLRILTNQWIVDFIFVDEVFRKHNIRIHDIITHPTHGVCFSVTQETKPLGQ